MKKNKVVLVLIMFVMTICSYAQTREVKFLEITLPKALELSLKENKPVFVDCYTTWCGPCKYMTNTVFKEDAVADYFNNGFICVKIDCEKGEGPEVAKKYGVTGYPTFLFLDAKGEELHKIVGASEGAHFISSAKRGLDPKNSLASKKKRFESGDKNIEFLFSYFNELKSINESKQAGEVGKRVIELTSKENLFTKEMWNVVSFYQISRYGSDMWNFIIDNSDKYVEVVGKEKVAEKVGGTLHPFLFSHITGRSKENSSKADFKAYLAVADKFQPKNIDILYSFARLGQARVHGKFNTFFNAVIKEYKTMNLGEHYRVMFNIIDYLCENISDKQKMTLVETLKASEIQQNDYMKANYKTFYDKLGVSR